MMLLILLGLVDFSECSYMKSPGLRDSLPFEGASKLMLIIDLCEPRSFLFPNEPP